MNPSEHSPQSENGDEYAYLDNLRLTPEIEVYLSALNQTAENLGLDELTYASFVSAVSRLSKEELSLRRSLLHLKDAEGLLRDHLQSAKHEERLVNEWVEKLNASAGSETTKLEKKKAHLWAKSKEYQKEVEKVKASMPTEQPTMNITELVEYKDRLKKKEQELKTKRAKIQTFQGLPPNLALARLELQKARDQQMQLVQIREGLLGKMAQNMR